MSITINNNHWLVADWIMRKLFEDIQFEMANSYEKHLELKKIIENSIKLHTYSIELNSQNDLQPIADLGYLIKKSENRKLHNSSADKTPTEAEMNYANKISKLKSTIESNFQSTTSNNIFNSEKLENEYRKSIWLYLEKISYYLIYLNKELGQIEHNSELNEIKNYKPNFNIQISNSANELTKSELFNNLINLIPRNESLKSAILYLGNDQQCGIINYGNHEFSNETNRYSKFQRVFKIRQEWGGSYWKVRYSQIDNTDEFDGMLYQEINKFKMEFNFKLS